MRNILLVEGKGRTKILLNARFVGNDLLINISNKNAHIGAVAIGEYDPTSRRTSTSVFTRIGHKDDAVAQKAAYLISRLTKSTVCVIGGIHIPDITTKEIEIILRNTDNLVGKFCKYLETMVMSEIRG